MRQVLGAGDPVADAGRAQRQPHAAVAEACTAGSFQPNSDASSMPDEAGDEDVEGNGDVGRDGADGGDQAQGRMINEKARRSWCLVGHCVIV